MNADVREVNFDGLVGPTHNYGGLSFGNQASAGNARAVSNPKLAALQGLAKMRALHNTGLVQGVLPPHARPHGPTLRALGFGGSTSDALAEAASAAPELLAHLMSASAMWAANAATVAPSIDSADGRVHFTPANLVANTHRSIEAEQTATTLRSIFADPERFVVHEPLPPTDAFGDEGAANHSRLAPAHDRPGTHLFIYGRSADEPVLAGGRFPRRQTLAAAKAVARLHQLDGDRTLFVRQNPAAIDAGAFHNDVVAVVNERVVLCHQDAYSNTDGSPFTSVDEAAAAIRAWGVSGDHELIPVVIGRDDVSLADAVSSYLFNSQLVTLPDSTMTLIAPSDAIENQATATAIDQLVADPTNPIATATSFDLRQSMRNGGGPACLRLRVPLSAAEREAMSGRVLVDHGLLDELEGWVHAHYRDELRPDDLRDPALTIETFTALDQLTAILELGSIYPFQ